MKMLLKGAILASLGLAAVSTAQAQWANTDLILGFTGSSSGNDVLFDIGTPASIGVGTPLNTTTDLGSLVNFSLWNSGGYTAFGVVGYQTGAQSGIYSTAPLGSTPNSVPNHSAFNGINLTIQDTGSLIDGTGNPANSAVVSTANGNSWHANMTVQAANTFYNDYGNPDAVLSGNTGFADLYLAQANGSNPQLLGVFSVSGNDLTFTSTPEPSSSVLLGAAGVLVFAFGRFFNRKS